MLNPILNKNEFEKSKGMIAELVAKFENNKDFYTSNLFKEEEAKIEFINPMFEALGWDVHNKQKLGPSFKEVIFEESLAIGKETKAPDYSFRLGGQLIFYLEAKKPNINIKDDKNPAYQARRYGWNAKIPIVILTDFEELAIYETTTKPKSTEKASTNRVLYYTCQEYLEKWEEIYSIFSKDAVQKELFQKFVVDNTSKTKRGTQSIDAEFLKDIEKWRLLLARNIALRNKELSLEELNLAVQLIIDRIVFFRMAEDRGIERYQTLFKLAESENIYKQLCEVFKKADLKYNSGLFHFNVTPDYSEFVDNITLHLTIDDGVFKEIFSDLYYPYSPYEFSVISPEILGNIYENFLGSVIRLTPSHQAKVELKPEIQKSGGVYYTPQFIVKTIVENTVGKLIEGKSPNQISKLKILDPACGSGSFLLGAFQKILDYHLDYYMAMERPPKDVYYVGKDNQPRLTIREKKRILTNNIYGVDIDVNAVEVTKLSLLLKVLEDENKDVLEQQQKLFQEKVLPNLSYNIKCGNSLINDNIFDIYDNLSSEEIYKINPFDWESEFKTIFENGGFDAVIGNPPYIRVQEMDEISLDYYNEVYSDIVSGNYDTYILFIKKGFDLINKDGKFGYIVPNKFFTTKYGSKIRYFLEKNHAMDGIIDFSANQIFENATTYTCLLYLSKKKNNDFLYKKYALGDSLRKINFDNATKFNVNIFQNGEKWVFKSNHIQNILEKILIQPIKFGDIAKLSKGSSTGNDNFFILDYKNMDETFFYGSSKLKNNIIIEKELVRPFIHGKDVKRYENIVPSKYLLFPYYEENNKFSLIPMKIIKKEFPNAFDYINEFRDVLKSRKIETNYDDYYKYSAARNLPSYNLKKIMIPDLLVSNRIGFDFRSEIFHGAAIHNITFKESLIKENELLILGILNSKLFWFFICNTSTSMSGNAFRLTPMYLKPFKFPDFNLINADLKKDLNNLILQMFDLKLKLSNNKTPKGQKLIEKQIGITDKKINELVYQFYDLSYDDIEIIENNLI